MKNRLLNVVGWWVKINFYLYLVYIPFIWFIVLASYAESDPVLVMQIDHGPVKGADQVTTELVRSGAVPYAIEERAATIYVKAESVWPVIFFKQLGDWGDAMNPVLPLFNVAMLWFLMRIFDSLRRGEVFAHQHARYIQWIGGLLIVKNLYQMAMAVFIENYLKGMDLPYTWARGHTPDGFYLHLGILVLCLGLVYRHGVKLKEEAELVV